MHFNIEGPKGTGSVHIHLIKYRGHSDFQYQYFFVDIPGQQRIYLENADASTAKSGEGKKTKLFGIKWI
jgi:mitochondrial import inner membrane translocase subunit TIM21